MSKQICTDSMAHARGRTEPPVPPMPPMPPMSAPQAAERLVTLAWMVVAAATVGEGARLSAVVHRFHTVLLEHLGDSGPSMWAETEGALWRSFHLALLTRARALVRAVILDDPVVEPADDLVFVAQRYRTVVARRSSLAV